MIVELKHENEFKLTVEDLESKISERTKILVMPFPNNPTGSIMTKEDLEPIAEFVKTHDLYVLSDEIYSELSYKGEHVSIASLPGMRDRTIVINGFSKGFAMTGWRLGYCCGPEVILKQMIKLHQFAIMCAPTNSQYAAVEGLRSCEDEVAEMRKSYNHGGIILLKRGTENQVCKLPQDERQLYTAQRMISPAWTEKQVDASLLFAEKLSDRIPICQLYCTQEPSAAAVMKEYIDKYLTI